MLTDNQIYSYINVASDCSHEIKRRLILGRKAMTNAESIYKSRHHFANKGAYSQCCDFSSSEKLGHKEGGAPKNSCLRTVALEKTLESPLDSKELKPVNPKGKKP